MKKIYFLFLLFFSTSSLVAQVGINTTDPKAQLEIKSSSETTPTNTDGLLIPKVNAFPVTNPTIDQQGMLVYLKNASGSNQPGFYYWDFATLVWKPIAGATASGTLDQAYDSGGAGLGKTITADAGAVLIDGTDGLVSTGMVNSGVVVPSGIGTRMVWNPRKSAFRAGTVMGGAVSPWDDPFVGLYSAAFGFQTQASGDGSVAFGIESEATGDCSAAFGSGSQAMGSHSATFGNGVSAIGNYSTAFGQNCVAFGSHATAFGYHNSTRSYGETVLGIGATDYTTSINGANQFRTANATDRLFVIGNAIDANSNNVVETAERSDALIILKNGLTRLPSTTTAMITAADGKVVVTKEYLQSNPFTWGLDGNTGTNTTTNFIGTTDNKSFAIRTNNTEKVRILTTGEVGIGTINPLDKLHVIGNIRMVDGNEAAGKVLTSNANGTASWQNATGSAWGLTGNAGTDATINFIGTSDNVDVVFRRNNTKAGLLGTTNTSYGLSTLVSNTTGYENTAFGMSALRSNTTGYKNTAIGVSALEINSTGFGNTANGADALSLNTTAIYNVANGFQALYSTSTGGWNTATGANALYFNTSGHSNTANGSQALYKNSTGGGNVAVGIDALFSNTTGGTNVGVGRAALYVNSTGTMNTANGNWSLHLNQTGSNNTASGSSSLSNNIQGSLNSCFGSESNVFASNLNNATAIGANARVDASNSLVLGSINGINGATADVNVGIGTTTPDRKLEVSGTGDQFARITTTGTSDVGIDFKRLGTATDWQIRNDAGLLIIGQSGDDLATVTDKIKIGSGSFIPAADNSTVLGQSTRRWTAVYAVNGVIQTSDANDKKQMLPLTQGLDKIKSLRPISFQWKDDTIDKSSTHLGFVAQEVQQVLPEIVVDHEWSEIPDSTEKVWEKTERLGMKYAEIIPVLVKAMQEQQTIIDSQKQLLDTQSKTMLDMLSRLKTLESK